MKTRASQPHMQCRKKIQSSHRIRKKGVKSLSLLRLLCWHHHCKMRLHRASLAHSRTPEHRQQTLQGHLLWKPQTPSPVIISWVSECILGFPIRYDNSSPATYRCGRCGRERKSKSLSSKPSTPGEPETPILLARARQEISQRCLPHVPPSGVHLICVIFWSLGVYWAPPKYFCALGYNMVLNPP